MSFKTLLTYQPHAAQILTAALESGKLPHALLFAGPSDKPLWAAACELARCLVCLKPKNAAEACGECAACKRIPENHSDVYVLRAAEDSSVIKIEEVREMRNRAALRPLEAQSKLFIIEHAEQMNDAAQNALLKVLEEPGGRTYFALLSTAPERLLSTVRSRTQAVHFSPENDEIATDAETLVLRRELARLAVTGKLSKPLTPMPERRALADALEHAACYLRQALVMRVGAEEILGPVDDIADKRRLATTMDEAELCRRIEVLGSFRQRIAESANLKLALSVLAIELEGARNAA